MSTRISIGAGCLIMKAKMILEMSSYLLPRLPDSSADLGPHYKFKLGHKLTHKPETVGIVVTGDAPLLRQVVNRQYPGRSVVS